MSNQSANYGLQYHARSIVAQESEKGANCWLVGTNVIAEVNEIQILQLDGEKDRLAAVRTFNHPQEIWSIVPSPSNPRQFVTTYTNGSGFGASLWSIPEEGKDLQQQVELSKGDRDVRAAVWNPVDSTRIAVIKQQSVTVEQLSDSASEVVQQSNGDEGSSFSSGAAWSKKDVSQLATSLSGDIQIRDTRSMKAVASRARAHASTIRCLDFANGSSFYLASCGDDSRINIWDTRLFKAPLISLSDHAHWVWQCKFSPAYDQMLLSSSSDTTVQLHHIPRLGKTAVKAAPQPAADSQQWQSSEASCAAVFDSHDDSVYGVAWSHIDPWVFASISYDGRVIINRVPSSVKYSILI